MGGWGSSCVFVVQVTNNNSHISLHIKEKGGSVCLFVVQVTNNHSHISLHIKKEKGGLSVCVCSSSYN